MDQNPDGSHGSWSNYIDPLPALVKEGGINLPWFFNVYVNELIKYSGVDSQFLCISWSFVFLLLIYIY